MSLPWESVFKLSEKTDCRASLRTGAQWQQHRII